MSKKTIITVLGFCVSLLAIFPLPQVIGQVSFFLLGILIVFFTRAKVSFSTNIQNKKTILNSNKKI